MEIALTNSENLRFGLESPVRSRVNHARSISLVRPTRIAASLTRITRMSGLPQVWF
jgi:hypothetical protein